MHRPRKVSVDALAAAVVCAAQTSRRNAARKYGISTRTIAKEMERLGVPARRPGNYTFKELDTIGRYLVE